ncbi:MAG: UbiX family flavin prenyltransferase [Cyanobacteria bacterium]|nr:UbiX family flavin prenyltransferase [Cyanobacteriota bacterium]
MTSSSPQPLSPQHPAPSVKPIIVGITGASGSILGFSLVKELLLLDQTVSLVMTEKSIQVIFEEMQLKVSGANPDEKVQHILKHLGLPDTKKELLKLYGNNNIGAAPASGTHLTLGMVIIPCSMGTLGRVANGISDNLISRAADVTLKEGRKLILVPRETPLNAIHLRNMLTLSQMGVAIIPPVLSFYLSDFNTLDGQIRYTLGKVLDQLGLDHHLHQRWGNQQENL